jgi:hypothetical protein
MVSVYDPAFINKQEHLRQQLLLVGSRKMSREVDQPLSSQVATVLPINRSFLAYDWSPHAKPLLWIILKPTHLAQHQIGRVGYRWRTRRAELT